MGEEPDRYQIGFIVAFISMLIFSIVAFYEPELVQWYMYVIPFAGIIYGIHPWVSY